jgi:hypothetical protein
MAEDFKLSTTGNFSTINLNDLKKHDAIEIDGSLSRNDFYFGDDLHFDPKIWHTVAKDLDLYNIPLFGKGKYVTIETAAKASLNRMREAKRVNPNFNASALEKAGVAGTAALYTTILWDYEADAAPKSWIRSFFGRFFSVLSCYPRRPAKQHC